MAPARPQASRASSTQHSSLVDLTDDQPYHQAGRSAATLNAAASAQSLRQWRRSGSQGLSKNYSSPNLLRKKSRPSSTVEEAGTALDPVASASTPPPPPTHAPGTLRSNPPSAPADPAPSDPTSSDNSNSRKGSDDSGESNRPKTLAPAGPTVPFPPAPPIPVSSQRPRTGRSEMSQRDGNNHHNRLSNPRSVRELGSDYTRYYNPFATGNNSQQDLNTPSSTTQLLAPGGFSSTDLSNRLADPFHDSKRLSNPFDSAQNTAPGSPVRLHSSSGGDKEGYSAIPSQAAYAAMLSKPGTPAFIREADPEKTPFYPYIDDRLGAPEYAFPLFTDTKEDDDDMHMPQWDDDIRHKPKFRDHFTRENIVSTFGMAIMLIGLLCIFVVLPVVSYTGTSLIPYSYDTPLDQFPKTNGGPNPDSWDYVTNQTFPLMSNVRVGLVDPDTPQSAMTRKDINGNTMNLVFSDEFNAQNRTFYPGDDPYWYGFDGWYGATQDLEWYDPDAINTGDGTLQIQLDKFNNHNLMYRSGMLHSWNQTCFKGGVFEVSVSLPGPGGVHGLWPGIWTMGNLGRPGYLATTDGMWPYTYSTCDAGITPNQSMTDGTSNLPGQRLPSCPCANEDHPTPGTGRGAPEIDILEASGDWGGMGLGVATQSFQVAPFDIWYYPNYDFMENPNYNLSFVNTYTGGPYQQAVSTTSMLNNKWYDGQEYQKYAFEYAPGGDENAYIQWYIGEEEMMRFDGRAVGPNGNVGQRLVSEEPMSMVINLGFSNSWVDINWAALKFPTIMRVDYVRLYQLEGQEMMTCDPPGYETTPYIAAHPDAYSNANLTHWSDTGYDWPKNTFMNGCSA